MNKTEQGVANSSFQRAPLLDLFRIILCVGVFVYHLTPERCSSGPLSVNGFLVMSGFLVGFSVFSKPKFDAETFYRGKCWRLLPMAAMVFIAAVIFKLWIGEGTPNWTPAQWVNFSLVSFVEHYDVPLWYLAVECILLLVVPFFVFLTRVRCCFELCLLCDFLFVWFLFAQIPDNAPFGNGLYFSPLVRSWQFMAALLLGCYFAKGKLNLCVKHRGYKYLILILFVLFLIAEVILMILKQGADLNYWNYTFEFDVLTTAFYLILVPGIYSLRIDLPRIWGALLYWGAVLTYPVFLVHVVARDVCARLIGKFFGVVPHINIVCATFVVSLIAAGCLLWLDVRLQQLRKSTR